MINLFFRTSETHIHAFTNNGKPVIKCDILINPYSTVNDFFKFGVGDLVIVLSAGAAINIRNIAAIASATSMLTNISSVSVNRVFIFTEDLYAVKDDTAEEIIFLRRLVDYMKYSNYRIFHCEQNVNKMNTLGLEIEYFDWFIAASVDYYTRVLTPIEVTTEFNNKLCCLNRRFGEHRYLASAVFSNYSNIYFSQQYSLEDTSMYHLDVTKLSNGVKDLVYKGFANLKNRTILVDRAMPVELIDPFEYASLESETDLYSKTRNAFCSIITESKFHSNFPNFSEKTLRVVYSGRPFLLLAPPGTLKLLQQLGIKTFSEFWDESYDAIQDHTQRFQCVMDIALKIQSTESPDIESFVAVLEHNQRQIKSIPRRMYELQLVESLRN